MISWNLVCGLWGSFIRLLAHPEFLLAWAMQRPSACTVIVRGLKIFSKKSTMTWSFPRYWQHQELPNVDTSEPSRHLMRPVPILLALKSWRSRLHGIDIVTKNIIDSMLTPDYYLHILFWSMMTSMPSGPRKKPQKKLVGWFLGDSTAQYREYNKPL